MNRKAIEGIGMTSQRTRDRLIERLLEQGIKNFQLLDVMRATPRHLFLDEALAHRAYEDVALPIGHNQTISQPYIVARMTELLMAGRELGKTLEVGTGCGYQTAILSPLAEHVLTVERIKPLLDKARQRIRMLQLHNVTLRHADGGFGWTAKAPYDSILSAAAPREIPDELLQQLADGGRLVIPVGDERRQNLVLVQRNGSDFQHTVVEPVKFVPFLSGKVG